MADEFIHRNYLIKQLYLETDISLTSPVMQTIETFPAADVQPVKHGRWSYRDDYGNHVPCHCTNCGCRAHTETGDAGCQTLIDDILSKFCPNCGARMDGDEE